MIKYILLLLITPLTILQANEAVKITVNASCYDSRNILRGEFFNTDSRKEKFTIAIRSKKLDLSKDAIHDNTGGYVNIAEEKYALISNRDSYRLYGNVERSRTDNINQFTSHIYNRSQKLITTKELYALKNRKNLKFMQKINLEYKHDKTNVTEVYFDEKVFEQEYQKCEEQIERSRNSFYLQVALLLLLLVGILYFLIRKFKR